MKSVEYTSDENILCEHCRMEFGDAEAYLVHTRQCRTEDRTLRPSPGRDGNYSEQREPEELDETSENDGNSESDYGGYYRLTTDPVSNGYQYLNDDTEDNDDETSVADSQECEETLCKEGRGPRRDSEIGIHVKPSQITEPGRPDAVEDNGPSRVVDENSFHLIADDASSIQSKMLDVNQLYVVLFQLQQQQLLQLRLIDIIQKKLAENILPTTGDILSSLPDLATLPRLAGPAASVFGSQTPQATQRFPVNGALSSTPLGAARFPEDDSNGQGVLSNHCGPTSLWSGLPLLPPPLRKTLVSENGGEDQRKRDKAEDQSKNHSSEGPRVENLSIGLPVSLTSEQRPPPASSFLFEQNTTKSVVFGSSVADLTEAFKKGKTDLLSEILYGIMA